MLRSGHYMARLCTEAVSAGNDALYAKEKGRAEQTYGSERPLEEAAQLA